MKSEAQTAQKAAEVLKKEPQLSTDRKNKADNDEDEADESEDDIFGNQNGAGDVKTKAEGQPQDQQVNK